LELVVKSFRACKYSVLAGPEVWRSKVAADMKIISTGIGIVDKSFAPDPGATFKTSCE
jgi:hypothetical protein